ncbi:MAG: 2Fe-2S iron-sulfur cluster-binding protein [Acidobacteria bacterium]|nr:2Fe-2S iron-sulfur cluster-binding protein [Acidobacteriota bacterium]
MNAISKPQESPGRSVAQVRIRRGGPQDSTRYDTFEVPRQEGMSVLDALIWIRQHVDSSVSMRYSCLNANACKECSALVDGKVTYLCTARLGETPVTVDPLRTPFPNARLFVIW